MTNYVEWSWVFLNHRQHLEKPVDCHNTCVVRRFPATADWLEL